MTERGLSEVQVFARVRQRAVRGDGFDEPQMLHFEDHRMFLAGRDRK
jgi:hypothetical protein